MRLLVIEDAPQTTTYIQCLLSHLMDEEDVAGVCYVSSLAEARNCVETFTPNTVLFDINLPDGSGFDIVSEWHDRNITFICMSAYPREHYIDELLSAECLAFVEKDVPMVLFRDQLYAALQKALRKLLKKRAELQDYIDALEHGRKLERRLKETESKLLAVKQGLPAPGFQPSDDPLERFQRGLIKLPALNSNGQEVITVFFLESILYAEADDKNLHLVSQNGTVLVKMPLGELEERLSPKDFVRCHKSYIVRVSVIRRAISTELYLANGEIVPLARSYKEAAKTTIHAHFGEGSADNPFRAKRSRSFGGSKQC